MVRRSQPRHTVPRARTVRRQHHGCLAEGLYRLAIGNNDGNDRLSDIVVPAIRGHKIARTRTAVSKSRVGLQQCVCDVGERAKKKTDVNGPTAGAETRSGDLRGAPNSFASQITVLRTAVMKTLLSHTVVVWSSAAVCFACKSLSSSAVAWRARAVK